MGLPKKPTGFFWVCARVSEPWLVLRWATVSGFSSWCWHLFCYVTNQLSKANSAFYPSGVGKWVPASAGKAKAGIVHTVSRCTWGVQVKLWDPFRTCAVPECLRGVITTRRYTNPRLPYLYLIFVKEFWEYTERRRHARMFVIVSISRGPQLPTLALADFSNFLYSITNVPELKYVWLVANIWWSLLWHFACFNVEPEPSPSCLQHCSRLKNWNRQTASSSPKCRCCHNEKANISSFLVVWLRRLVACRLKTRSSQWRYALLR